MKNCFRKCNIPLLNTSRLQERHISRRSRHKKSKVKEDVNTSPHMMDRPQKESDKILQAFPYLIRCIEDLLLEKVAFGT